jgi:hypothetical protein
MSDKEKSTESAASAETQVSPLETLTSLVLDAADAANDSAQVTSEALTRLSRVVEINEETTKAVRNAPAILGAVILGIGIVLAVVIAVIFRDLSAKSDALVATMDNQAAQIEKLNQSIKNVAHFEEVLKKYETVAEDTTQRAMVVLREQTKADRAALIDLESRRLKEILGSARADAAARPAAIKAEEAARAAIIERSLAKFNDVNAANLEKAISRIEARVNSVTVDKAIARLDGRINELASAVNASRSSRAASVGLSEAQGRELRKTAEDVATLRKEVGELRALLERKAPDMQAGVPTFKKP